MKFKLGRTKSLFSSVFFLMLTMVLLFGMVYGIRYVCYKQGDTNMPIYKVDTDDKKISLSFDFAWGSNNIDDILEILDIVYDGIYFSILHKRRKGKSKENPCLHRK